MMVCYINSVAGHSTFFVQRGTFKNTFIGTFNIPAASIPLIPLVFMTLLIPVYEFSFVLLAREITGHPNGITELQRVGVELVFSAISMIITGLVEVKRKNYLNDHNNHKIGLFWLSFHYAIFGIANMFTLVGLLEFSYKKAPQGMRFPLLSRFFHCQLVTIWVQSLLSS